MNKNTQLHDYDYFCHIEGMIDTNLKIAEKQLSKRGKVDPVTAQVRKTLIMLKQETDARKYPASQTLSDKDHDRR